MLTRARPLVLQARYPGLGLDVYRLEPVKGQAHKKKYTAIVHIVHEDQCILGRHARCRVAITSKKRQRVYAPEQSKDDLEHEEYVYSTPCSLSFP